MSWINLLQGTSTSKHEAILQSLSSEEGLCFQEYCNHFRSRISNEEIFIFSDFSSPEKITLTTVDECLSREVAISLGTLIEDPLSEVTKDRLRTLISLGLLFSKDGTNFGLTQVGYDFLTYAEALP